MNDTTGLATFLKELAFFVEPVADAAQNKETLNTFCHVFGVDLDDQGLTLLLADVRNVAATASSSFDNLTRASDLAAADVVSLISTAIQAIDTLADAEFLQAVVTSDDDLALEVLDYLSYRYLCTRMYLAESLLSALGVVTHEVIKTTDPGGRQVDFVRINFQWSRLRDFVQNHERWAYDVYGWGKFANEDQRTFDFVAAIRNAIRVLHASGLSLAYLREISDTNEIEFFLKNVGDEQIFEAALPLYQTDPTEFDEKNSQPFFSAEAGLKFVPFGDLTKPEELGLALAPYVKGSVPNTQQLSERLTLGFYVSGEVAGGTYLAITPDGINVVGGGATDARFDFSATYRNPDRSSVLLAGDAESTHVRTVSISGAVGGSMRGDFHVAIGFRNLSVGIDCSADSFLSAVLSERIVVDVGDVFIGWRPGRGVYFEGGTSLEVSTPLNVSLGVISVRRMSVALRLETDVSVLVTLSLQARLGPAYVSPEGVGIHLTIAQVTSGAGLLGKYDIAFGFEPPTGLSILLDAGPITGGGFLSYDDTAGRYFGALELEVYDIGIKAFGILDTRLPGGRPAYSFLILVSAEFTPIPLGFGFNLVGVGGLVGIHRSVDIEVLRNRLGSGALDHILFPTSPVNDAVQIVSDLRAVFPPTEDRYIFGPTARLSWGTSALVQGKLGIMLELPEPGRIVLVGRVRVALPKPDDAIVNLNLDVFGQIVPQRTLIELDGKLTESSVGPFKIDGAFAFRLVGGDSPSFALAIGGFNENYQPPPNFPKLQRVTVPIPGDVITLQGYLAITSNTFQIGAAVHVYAEASEFNIEGDVSFDALFTFTPFSFIGDFSGKVTLSWGDTELAGIHLDAKISGPAPWHAWGEACLVIRWWPDICVPFDTPNFGDDRQIELPVQDPWPQLSAAIESAANWSSSRPKGTYRSATMTAASDGSNPIDPTGGLVFRQPVVPLGRRITRFGQTKPPGGADRFPIEEVLASGMSVQWSSVDEFFAPASFENLSDDEKLSRPSFERMAAGFAVADDAVNHGAGVGTSVDYETQIIDSAFESRHMQPYRPTVAAQLSSLQRASAALAPLRESGARKFTSPTIQPLVAMTQERFIVAANADLAQRTDIVAPATKGFVLQALAEHLVSHPDQVGTLQVVSLEELAA